MKILVTGATGLIGTRLLPRLIEMGHELVILSRDPAQATHRLGLPCEIHRWNPKRIDPPTEALQGIHAVIHLAGESVASGPWTDKQKKAILDSRILSTRNLIQAVSPISTLSTFISASAIGFYGDRGDEVLTESSSSGKGFLAEVCRQWEAETQSLPAHVRTVLLRTGVVLSEAGGALEQILRPFQLGAGGPLGDGKQWISWIHQDDHIEAILHALHQETVRGPINLVSPAPVRQSEFAQTLGSTLGKPSILRIPKWALRLALGEMSDLVLNSQRVLPKALRETGFNFKYHLLRSALEDLTRDQRDLCTRIFTTQQWIPKPIERVFSFFYDEKNLETLTPPWLNFHVLGKSTPAVTEKTEIDYQLKIHGIPVRWRSRITQWRENQGFTDIQIKGPYQKWEHTHRFIPMKGGTRIEDRIIYKPPGGIILHPVIGRWVARDVKEIFNYRKNKIEEIFGKKEEHSK